MGIFRFMMCRCRRYGDGFFSWLSWCRAARLVESASFHNHDLHIPVTAQHVDAHVLIVADEQEVNVRCTDIEVVKPKFT
jgi:hypothetical protein